MKDKDPEVLDTALLKTRKGEYFFCVDAENTVIAGYRRFSDPNRLYIIRVRGKNLSNNFFEAAARVDDLTPMDVIIIALALGVPLPVQKAINLLGSWTLVEKLARQMAIDVCV